MAGRSLAHRHRGTDMMDLSTLLFMWLTLLSTSTAQYTSNDPDPCPPPCGSVGEDGWRLYHDMSVLELCQSTVLIRMNIYDESLDYFRACSATAPQSVVNGPDDSIGRIAKRQTVSTNSTALVSVPLDIVSWDDSPATDLAGSARSSVDQLRNYVQGSPDAVPSIVMARTGSVIAGLYAGDLVDVKSTASALDAFSDLIDQGKVSTRLAAQTCTNMTSEVNRRMFAVMVDTSGDVAQVQQALRSWNEAECVTGGDHTNQWEGTGVSITVDNGVAVSDVNITLDARSTSLERRDGCQVYTVVKDDTCTKIHSYCSSKYGTMTKSQFCGNNGFANGDYGVARSPCANWCNRLQLEQALCCTSGGLPVPKPDANGNCASYTVKDGDTCAQIAKKHYTTTAAIETNNTKTWAWFGCQKLLGNQTICLSDGKPPIPGNIPGAKCGPQMNRTSAEPFPDPDEWVDMNPCPLRACCNIWGQCGINPDFCDPERGPTGNPGTAPENKSGCISNCGTEIITGPPTAKFEHVGYFESFQNERKCFRMPPSAIPNFYTIVHWGFGDVKKGTYEVSAGPNTRDWEKFKAMTRFKRVLSIGGWAFSTDEATYDILREGVKPANRQTFADQLVKFVNDEGLDGLDIDWEYPAAPDNQGEGIPLGDPKAGLDYLAFLELVRAKLPSEKSLAIAAPASYWYAMGFPMDKIADVVTYIVYMTYDLHGQWDHGNPWTNQGCKDGNCLRSHVNITETSWAMSMITKAGVPAAKVYIGQALYGRSFHMTDPNCYTPECTFTKETAKPGRCTNTGGYLSNLEIRELERNPNSRFVEIEDAGTVLLYDGDWISYLDTEEYQRRAVVAGLLGFGGTSDWAIDLNITDDGLGGSGDGEPSGTVFPGPEIYLPGAEPVGGNPWVNFIWPPIPLANPIEIKPDPYVTDVVNAWNVTTPVTSGTITTSTVYVTFQTTVTTLTAPTLVVSQIDVYNNIINSSFSQQVITLEPSIQLPNVTTTQDPITVTGEDDDDTTILPGITFVWSPPVWPWRTPVISGSPTPSPPPDLSSICPECPEVVTIEQDTAKPPCTMTRPPQQCGKENRDDDDRNDENNDNDDDDPDCIGCDGAGCPIPPCATVPCIGPGCTPPGQDNNNQIGDDGFREDDRPGECEEREVLTSTLQSCTRTAVVQSITVSCTDKTKEITLCPPLPTVTKSSTLNGYVMSPVTVIDDPDASTPEQPLGQDDVWDDFDSAMNDLQAIDDTQDPGTEPGDPTDPTDPTDPDRPNPTDPNDPTNERYTVDFCVQVKGVYDFATSTTDYSIVLANTEIFVCDVSAEFESERGTACDIVDQKVDPKKLGADECSGEIQIIKSDRNDEVFPDYCPLALKYGDKTLYGTSYAKDEDNPCSFMECPGSSPGSFQDNRVGYYYFKNVVC